MFFNFYTAIILIVICKFVNCFGHEKHYKISSSHNISSSSALSFNSNKNKNNIINYIIAKLEIEPKRNALKISNQAKCEINLKSDTVKDWKCDIEYSTNEDIKVALFCFCSNEYDCGEEKRLLMSVNYSRKIRRKNRLMNLNRGADYQCEMGLKAVDSQKWSCKLYKNKHTLNIHEKIVCKCSYKKKCLQERIVDFY